uniref:Uncharacterized protein n=1 Tax=Panagrolaimus sp. JU765 TaxID=591449 RepID=A0AC34R2N0_9BILA
MAFHEDGVNREPVWSRGQSNQPSAGFGGYHGRPPVPSSSGIDRRQPSVPQQTTIIHSSIKPIPDSEIYKVGIYGWRKRCLYAFILALTLMIVVNLVLTIWILVVLDFTPNGMGALEISDSGIRITGKTRFEKPVQFSQISTENNEALTLESASGVTMNARNISGDITASLDLSPDGKISASCKKFEIVDRNNKLLFFADTNEVGLKLDNLRILDDGGSVFEGAIQTATIRPEPDSPLALESPTRNVKINAGQDVEIFSNAGEFSLNTLLDINLQSKSGDIRIEGNVFMTGLDRSHGRGVPQYQLCICQSGQLFMAAEDADCRADKSICQD